MLAEEEAAELSKKPLDEILADDPGRMIEEEVDEEEQTNKAPSEKSAARAEGKEANTQEGERGEGRQGRDAMRRGMT